MREETLNQERKENAIAFMMFAYFGITSADISTYTEEAVVDRAYKDATDGVLLFQSEKKQAEAKDLAKEIIINSIERLQECQDVYDVWHKKLCDALMDCYGKYRYKQGYNFTYGIAQKWVNMTIKYFYIVYFFCKACGYDNMAFQLKYGQMINKYIHDFHVPIDSNTITAAKYDFDIADRFECWHKINRYEDYFDFQSDLRRRHKFHDGSNYSPIDWECPAWIDYAIRKK